MTCENQISTEDLENAKLDATTLGEVATSRAGAESGGALIDTTSNRFNDTTDTVIGRLKKMGYTVPVIYAGAISFAINDNVKTVDEGGVIYAPFPSALPFTTSGTFVGDDDARFFVVQGVTSEQLISDLSQSYSFDTIALMTASTIEFPLDKILVLKGYYAVADGFHDRIVSNVQNDYSVTLQNGLYANLIYNELEGIKPRTVGYRNDNSEASYDILMKLSETGLIAPSYKTINNIQSFFREWSIGNKYPIAFYSDSTTDGATTTGHVPSTLNVGGSFNSNSATVNVSPNSYPDILRGLADDLIKYPGKQIDIYNAGFDGQALFDLGSIFFDKVFFGFGRGLNNVDFSDVKGIVIGWGHSEVQASITDTVNMYKQHIEVQIAQCFERGIQPYIQESVFVMSGLATGEERSARNDELRLLILSTMKEVAQKYNLEILSLQKPMEDYALFSTDNDDGILDIVAPDMSHPNDMGHKFLAGNIASRMCALVVQAKYKTVLQPRDDRLRCLDITKGINDYSVDAPADYTFPFKMEVPYTVDGLPMVTFAIYSDRTRPLLYSPYNSVAGQDQLPVMEQKVNGTDIQIFLPYAGLPATSLNMITKNIPILILRVGLNVFTVKAPFNPSGASSFSVGAFEVGSIIEDRDEILTSALTRKSRSLPANIYYNGDVTQRAEDNISYMTSVPFHEITMNFTPKKYASSTELRFCFNKITENKDCYNYIAFNITSVRLGTSINGVRTDIHTATYDASANIHDAVYENADFLVEFVAGTLTSDPQSLAITVSGLGGELITLLNLNLPVGVRMFQAGAGFDIVNTTSDIFNPSVAFGRLRYHVQ